MEGVPVVEDFSEIYGLQFRAEAGHNCCLKNGYRNHPTARTGSTSDGHVPNTFTFCFRLIYIVYIHVHNT